MNVRSLPTSQKSSIVPVLETLLHAREEGGTAGLGLASMRYITRHHDVIEPVATVTFGPLPSPQVLGSPQMMKHIEGIYPDRCPEDPHDLLMLSREFAERSGLITSEVREALNRCDRAGVPASMTMMGNGVFGYGETAAEVLGPLGEVFMLGISKEGVRIVDEGSDRGLIPEDHPRYRSLKVRESLAGYAKEGVVTLEGLTAHGRGETFDYLIGERTMESALIAEKTAAALLYSAHHPVISVNGNTAALAAPDIADLQKITGARLR